jgi:hypothetical protein
LPPAEAPPDSFVFHAARRPLGDRSILHHELRLVAKAPGFETHD